MTVFRNDSASPTSPCHSSRLRSQESFWSKLASFPPSLYVQWAATPNSATRCISCVRIWISIGSPVWVMTVVCSDW